jgi:putative PIN family toxin of toxin-antitoxin system
MIRVVLDTNIYVSALVFGGKPAQVLQLAEAGLYVLVVSSEIRTELEETLETKFRWPRRVVKRTCSELWESAHWTVVSDIVHVVRDANDNHVLACAVQGGAGFLVTGDRDLLVHGTYRDIRIVTPAEFLAEFPTPGRRSTRP